MVLFIMLHKVVLSFESEDEILKCYIQMKVTEWLYFSVALFITLYKVVLSLYKVVLSIESGDHSNERY